MLFGRHCHLAWLSWCSWAYWPSLLSSCAEDYWWSCSAWIVGRTQYLWRRHKLCLLPDHLSQRDMLLTILQQCRIVSAWNLPLKRFSAWKLHGSALWELALFPWSPHVLQLSLYLTKFKNLHYLHTQCPRLRLSWLSPTLSQWDLSARISSATCTVQAYPNYIIASGR